ncbi:T9SS type A sorting domain-containing protein [Christiangramia sp.]|uniref:Ig-like domain-containing protein n=1 Tax=Christiangramia sp. TaxID=1931228 RepID=UPI00260D32E6|nr:T9SS type A sorting domain-containing protein [Christiangramia sp.]
MGEKLHSLFVYIIISLFSLTPLKVNAQCADYPSSISISASIQGSSTVCSDASITVNSNITQSGGTNPVYQWQQQVGTGTWTDITGATATTLSNYTSLQNNSKFRLTATYCQGTGEVQTYNGTSSGTLTVNQVKTGTVSINASNTTICPGSTVNFTASATNQGSSPTYSWRVNGAQQGTSATFSSSSLNNGDTVQLFMTSSQPCVEDFESNIVTINLKPAAPDTPGVITGETEICPNTTNHTYSITSVNRATSYQWILPSGWTGSSTTNSITITSGNAGDGKILKVKALNECGESTEQSITVNVGPGKPSTPSTISDPGVICPGSSVTFSVNNDPSVEYTWQIPNGWNIISGQGSNSITVTAGNYNQNGDIAVIASNECLDSDIRNLAVTVNEPVPANPINISGETIVCPNSSVSYTISNVQYADEYIWYIDGVEQTGQNGTSLSFNSGPPTEKLTIKVIAVNECVDSSEYSSITGATRDIKVDDGRPDPITISSNNGNELCPGDPVIFSVPDDIKADDYLWTVPTGWSINGSSNSNSISVTAGSTGQNGNITATAKSELCGEENASFAVSVKNPAPVVDLQVITGETTVCHNAIGLNYSFPSITNATNYEWNVPTGWNITNGNGTNSITVNAGTTDGNISVVAKNDCGNASAITLAVTSTDSQPLNLGSITSSALDANKNVCPPATTIDFSVPAVSDANSYNWIFPDAGWTIVSGAGTNSITVDVSSAAQSGTKTVKVEAVNICGTSTQSSYANIEVQTHIETSAGADVTVCKDTSYPAIPLTGRAEFGNSTFDPTFQTSGTGTFPNQPKKVKGAFTYFYKPTQTDYNAGQVTITVNVPKPNSAKDLCGNGTGIDSMVLTFKPDPTASVSAPTEICAGQTADVVFTGTANTTVTYKIGNGSNQTIQIGDSGSSTLITSALTTNTTVTLVSSQYTSGNSCSKVITGSASIAVNTVPGVTMLYDDVCTSATTVSPTLTNGVGAWQNGTYTASGELNSMIDATTGTFNPSALTPGTYTVTYTTPAAGGCEEVKITADVNIYEKVLITSQPEAVQNCEGTTVQFSVSATGQGISYQWFKGSVASGNEISGGTSNTLSLTNIDVTDAGAYLVVVSGTDPCSSITSTSANLIVDQNIIIDTQPEDITVCEAGNTTISVAATVGGIAIDDTYSYQWYKGTPGSGAVISGANSSSLPLNVVSPDDSGDYYVEITGPADYTCSLATSEVANVKVRATPTVQIGGDTSICDGGNADIIFSGGTPNTVVTYILNNDSANPRNINLDANGEAILNTGSLYSTSDTDTDFIYELQSVAYADDPNCSASVSGSVTVAVAPNPEVSISISGDQTEFCTADNNVYTPTLEGTGTYNGGNFSSNGLIIDSSTGEFTPGNEVAGNYTITYTIPAYGGCPEETTSLEISIYEEVAITSQPSNLGICSTSDAEFSITATGDNLTYQWYKVVGEPDINTGVTETDDTPVPDGNSAILSLPVATSEDAGAYYIKIAGTNACTPTEDTQIASEVVTLNVDEDIVILEPAEDIRVCDKTNASVEFMFVAHANGAPLTFEWIYGDGSSVNPDGSHIVSNLTERTDYPGYEGITVYEGTLTINNITSADQASYAVRIDGSTNNFICPEAVSNSFNLDVDPLPDPPSVEDVAYCLGDETTPLTATGSNLTWYDDMDNELAEAPTPSTVSPGETSYFVSQKDIYCESPKAEIVVTVYDLPAPPPLTAEELNIEYCLGTTASALSATASLDHTIVWYDSETAVTALDSAPTPQTTSAGTIDYWVSQTNNINTCESERVRIIVTINDLPNISIVNSGNETICEGDEITLTASDANDTDSSTTYSWDWTGNTDSALTGPAQNFSPIETTTYTVTATSGSGCKNTEEITINIDPQPVGGTLTGPSSVCITSPSGELDLGDYSGIIARWEYKPASSTSWTTITEETPDANYQFSGLTETTSYRVVVSSGVCEEVYSNEINIAIDPEPAAGQLLFNGNDRVFMMCEFPTDDYLVPLQTTGTFIGDIVAWQYRRNSQTSWTTIMDGSEPFTGNSLSGNQVNTVSNNESTLFRVEVQSGACTPNVYSDFATLSIIPSDIAPSPVQVTPGEVCLGGIVSMSSATGYGGSGTFEGGAFDNSSIANHGWRVMRYPGNTEYTFESAADNVRPERWMRTNPHDYQMAHPSGNGSIIYQRFDSCSCDSGNKGFAIVSGDNPSTLETPIFNLFTMDNPVLTFDQAYNLTYGDTIRVEISLDGGNTYNEEPLMEIGGPANPGDAPNVSGNYANFGDDGLGEPNNMELDLSNYAGLSNLRIRWLYDGSSGGIYTIDDIGLPEDPQNVQLIWYYDEDINDDTNTLEQIGEVNQSTVTYPQNGAEWPKIGWNDFEVQTALVFDTNGDPCESAENSAVASVYVFDNYTSTATALVGECGNTDVQLSATISGAFQGEITEFPSGEGSTVAWEVIESPAGYEFSDSHFVNSEAVVDPINDPNAIFQPPLEGNYTIRYTITPAESQTTRDILGEMVTQDISANPCPMTHVDTSFEFIDCTTLDFDGDDDYIDLGNNYNGNYFIEAWIRPFDRALDDGSGNTDASTGVIFSSSGMEIRMEDLPAGVAKNGRWYHIAVANNGDLWVDGVSAGKIDISGSGINNTSIGARYNANTKTTSNHFSGWIEELRIWNKAPTEKQIRFMMNQRLQLDGTGTVVSPLQGEVVPNLVIADGGLSSYYTDGTYNLDQDGTPFYNLTISDLAGYYRLYSDIPDPANLLPGYFDPALEPSGGNTPDHAVNKVPGRLYNITTDQENTSPTPYFDDLTQDGQNWATDNTWARPNVWDPPNSNGIDGTPIEWNIARINTNINSNGKNITLLGLLSETADKELSINASNFIRISHYLLLDGNMDLEGESQLLQDHGSILANSSKGWAEIEQKGRMSSFNYNYWTSPVSNQGANNNSGFMLNQVLFDASNQNNPQPVNFQNGYFVADKPKTTPITISNDWIWDFRGGDADIYGDWLHLGSDFLEIVGAGYSMKGTDGTVAPNAQKQNYAFRGKPNNGIIPTTELYLNNNQNYLVGNPYPSAIDAEQFLKENLTNISNGSGINENSENVFNGTLYYWDHFSGSTHILEEYIGGYATYTLSGSAPAISNDWRINTGGGSNNVLPQRYIPVAQGFFLNSASVAGENFSGKIIFKNTQRVFKRISTDPSIFLQQEEDLVKSKSHIKSSEDTRMKIRVKFESPKGYHRQILVTRDQNTSNGFDIGYDAPLIENNVEDMYWWFDDSAFVIQGVPSFEKEQILPLVIKTSEGGQFKIKIDETENWPIGKELYLKDKLNDTIHNILKEDFIAETEAGEIKDRFEIIFFKETAQDPDPVIPDPNDVINPDQLPIIDGLVGISYSTFSKQVKISNFDLLEVDKVMIFDMGGKLIQQYDELPTQREILLGMRPVRSGVYIIKVFSENGISDKKVVIK